LHNHANNRYQQRERTANGANHEPAFSHHGIHHNHGVYESRYLYFYNKYMNLLHHE